MCFLFCAVIANAQNYEDVVYLKNGSVIRGIIIEQVPNESLKIQTRDGNLFVYNFADIQKMAKEMPAYEQKSYSSSTVYKNVNQIPQKTFNKPKGYFGLVELGFAPSVNSYETLRISATVINGYRVLPQFAVGVGVGLQGYALDFGEMTIPIFAHLRSDFLNRSASPFVAFNIGYNLSVLGGYYGGLMMEPSLGASFNVGSKYRMTAGLGFAVDRVQGYLYSYYGSYLIKDWAFALNIKIGFSF